jgi:hypothetical protein
MTRPTDREIISHGLELLRDGVLYSALPGKLIEEFGLASEHARELAAEAITQRKAEGKRGKLGTKPFDQGEPMTRRPSDYQIITRALEMLKSGILTSNLSERLMDEFGLTPDRAHDLAEEAIKLHKKPGRRGRMDTKPIDKSG